MFLSSLTPKPPIHPSLNLRTPPTLLGQSPSILHKFDYYQNSLFENNITPSTLKIIDVLESLFYFYLYVVVKNQEIIYYFFFNFTLILLNYIMNLFFNFLSYFNKYERFFTYSQYGLLIIFLEEDKE